ncbi:MAG: carbohydrate-binding protein [Lachnospiraceae bacterium]|nr:carbohydrate-binding protein [Lachnospiraceae bacterium]
MKKIKKGKIIISIGLLMCMLCSVFYGENTVKAVEGTVVENGEAYSGADDLLVSQYEKSSDGAELVFKKNLNGVDFSGYDALFAWISGGRMNDTLLFRITDANNHVWEAGYPLGYYSGQVAFAFDSFVQNAAEKALNGAAQADFSNVKALSIVILNNNNYTETGQDVFVDEIYAGNLKSNYITNGDMSATESAWPYLPLYWNSAYSGGDGWSAIKVENGAFVGYAENSFGFNLNQTVNNVPIGMYTLKGDFRIQNDASLTDYTLMITDSDNNIIASRSITQKSDSMINVEINNIFVTTNEVKVSIVGNNIRKAVFADNLSLVRTGNVSYNTAKITGDFVMDGGLSLDEANKTEGNYGVKISYNHNVNSVQESLETVHIEAENYNSVTGSVAVGTKLYENSSYITGFAKGDSATYDITVARGGRCTVDLRASIKYSGTKKVNVYVDGILATVVDIWSTGSFATFQTFSSPEITLAAGSHTLKLEAATAAGYAINWIELKGNDAVPETQTPLTQPETQPQGQTTTVHIEAEEYAGATGGVYVSTKQYEESFYITGFAKSDSVIYNVNVADSGNYTIDLRASIKYSGTKKVNVYVDGVRVTVVDIWSTGSFATFQTFSSPEITLAAGSHTLKLEAATAAGYAINWIELKGNASAPQTQAQTEAPTQAQTETPTQAQTEAPTQSQGENAAIHIEAEDYADAYGGVYVSTKQYENSLYITGFARYDYASYNVNVADSGNYMIYLRASIKYAGTKKVNVYLDGTLVTTVDVQSTGSFATFQTFESSQVYITSGNHTLKLEAGGAAGYAINWIELKGDNYAPQTQAQTEAQTQAVTQEPTQEPTQEQTQEPTQEQTQEPTQAPETQYVPVVTGGYDLVVTNIAWGGGSISNGTPVTWTVTVRNQGDGDIPSGTIIGYQVQVDGNTGNITWCDSYSSGLKAGQSVELTCNGGSNGSTWSATNGTHTIMAWVDDVNRLTAEVNENNNTYSITLSVPASEVVTQPDSGNNIEGKTFFFLGSSVTYGSAAGGVSFVDYIAQRNNCTCVKEAVSGTTLVDTGWDSYVQRMLRGFDTNAHCDHFICQLSTNDASRQLTLGSVSNSYNLNDFDTSTIIGAMEYIICYAKNTWNCPVSFYTNTYYDSAYYQQMVNALYSIKDKWNIGIIDLWNNQDMRNISSSDYWRYMADNIHPNATGYLEWWTPVFEDYFQNFDYSAYQDDGLSAAARAKNAVLSYLNSISGSKTIIGIHNREPNSNPTSQTDHVVAITGQAPALWSGDFLYSSSDVSNRWSMIYECERQWNSGSIVQIMFHVAPPTVSVDSEKYGVDWNSGSNAICSSLSDWQWSDLITNGGGLNTAWKSRMDEYGVYLKYLQSKGVAVIVRPFHEMNQGVFWWGGRKGYNGTQALYRLTRDYFENTLGLDNLIWVWDMQDLSYDWDQYNPGENYWDVLAVDFYNGDGYTSFKYNYALGIAGSKMIAIGECDKLPTSSTLYSQPRWVFCMSWAELTFSYNNNSEIQNLYWAENVIVKNELPSFK